MKTIIKPLVTGLVTIAVTRTLPAQSFRNNTGIPYLNLSAYSARQQDAFSFSANQASLARFPSFSGGIYGERKFMLEGNDMYALALAIPSKFGGFGLLINYAGFKNFNEQKAGFAYARSLGNKASAGIQFNYYNYKIPSYNSASAISFEGGFMADISEKLRAGIHVCNPVGGRLGKTKEEKLPAVYRLGLGYDVSENFYTGIEIFKEENEPVNVTGGFQYHFKKQFFVRGGFRSDTESSFGGIGFIYRDMRIDVAASYHPQLGISPGILLLYNFKTRQK